MLFLAASCGDGNPSGDGGGQGAAPAGGTTGGGGDGATGGSASGRGGTSTAGDGGAAGESGGSATDCTRDADCVPLGDCYSASCEDGSCVGAARARGSECSDGFCNGFARCLPCLDDAPGREEDKGCSQDLPICAETASEPECVGCEQAFDCDDGVECTVDRCAASECENVPLPRGSACSDGICNGEDDENSCAPCVDDASSGVDSGCTLDLPRCDTSTTPRKCAGCVAPADCDDDNECTSEGCNDGVCEHATRLSGTPCPDGYCNGVRGSELCIHKACQTDVDCEDRAACTGDVCQAGFCAYTTNDEECPPSGDVCKPNVCTVGTGCRAIDVTQTLELLANGNLDDTSSDDWLETSATYSHVIFPYDYVPNLFPHTEAFIAWLGGGEALVDEQNSLSQVVTVPVGTVRIELSFFYQIWSEDLPDDHNYLRVNLRSVHAEPTDGELVTFHNQDETVVWTRFNATLDATGWAGTDIVLSFSGTGIQGYTNFFVDTISLVASVCE